MARRTTLAPTVAVHLLVDDVPATVAGLVDRIAAAGGTVRTLSTPRRIEQTAADGNGPADGTGPAEGATPGAELEIEIEGLDDEAVIRAVHGAPGVRAHRLTRSLDGVFGKRVIVIGGGAQVAQVALGAVSEADRHNLRGERISVDTIALVGEHEIAAAVRAVADLPRARLLVLAGSLMGGEITVAARELQTHGIPIISLNMAGSITEVADLVVSDPVQAGTMAVMAVADTASFDLARQRGRRY